MTDEVLDAGFFVEALRSEVEAAGGGLRVRMESLRKAAVALAGIQDVAALEELLEVQSFEHRPALTTARPEEDVSLSVAAREAAPARLLDERPSGHTQDAEHASVSGEDVRERQDVAEPLEAAPIARLGLSVRSYNALLNTGVRTVGDLLGKSDYELLELRNFGQTCLDETRAAIARAISQASTEPGRTAADANDATSVDAALAAVPIEVLNLSVRSYNALKRAGMHVVGDVMSRSDDELLAVPNFGRTSLQDTRRAVIAAENAGVAALLADADIWLAASPAARIDDRSALADDSRMPSGAQEVIQRFDPGTAAGGELVSGEARLFAELVQSVEARYLTVLGMRLEHTLDEVGRQLGVTRERVRQIEKRGHEFVSAVASRVAPTYVDEISRRLASGVVSAAQLVDEAGAEAQSGTELLVPILLKSLGAKNPRGYRGRISGYWTTREGIVVDSLDCLASELPLPDGRVPDILDERRLPYDFPLFEVLTQPGSPAAFHKGARVWVSRDARHGDAAFLLLEKHGQPAAVDALAEILQSQPNAVRETLRRDPRFRQLRPSGDWELSSWEEPE